MKMKHPKILYVCEACHEAASESCGRPSNDEIRVTPNGTWLCEECVMHLDPLLANEEFGFNLGEDDLMPLASDLPCAPKYVPEGQA